MIRSARIRQTISNSAIVTFSKLVKQKNKFEGLIGESFVRKISRFMKLTEQSEVLFDCLRAALFIILYDEAYEFYYYAYQNELDIELALNRLQNKYDNTLTRIIK